ncbi:MAG: hypothetical protein AAGK78_14160 [Planctomycetota bacterium]
MAEEFVNRKVAQPPYETPQGKFYKAPERGSNRMAPPGAAKSAPKVKKKEADNG